ncbi:universal stress protein [Streptomyces sp. NPDC004111]|uniref:universal stress protein n=1 Tax=Streptomyces sp. NPDC004111 TaxID=3364690 RepID=UPI003697E94F
MPDGQPVPQAQPNPAGQPDPAAQPDPATQPDPAARKPPVAQVAPNARAAPDEQSIPDVRTVTAGIDGSPESLDAADWAAREALLRRLSLHLVHVEPPPRPNGSAVLRNSALVDHAALHLSYAHPALGIIEEQLTGDPVETLAGTAESSELLVVGSRGNSALTGLMVGSVALAVAAVAACPVALVRAGEQPEDEREGAADAPFRPVLLGLDIGRPCDELLEYAFGAAAARRTALHVVHTWTLSAPPRLPARGVPDQGEEKLRRLAAVLTPWQHKFPGTEVVPRVVHGRAGHHLLKASAGAGLLVIGRSAEAGPRLGATAHSVIHHVPRPVVVVPHA